MQTTDYTVVDNAVAATDETIQRISQEVWSLAELSTEERESAKVHMRELEAAGFTITSRETSGQANAFIAEWENGNGGPKIGFLPEYDALASLGNAAEPNKQEAPNGNTNGHGCGHNLLGAACTGSAIALKSVMEDQGIEGLLRVYGCAAEETTGAKVYMARDGLFDDLDAALAWHPAAFAATGYLTTSAIDQIVVEFFGQSAHAGSDPWNGRSALDALELFTHGINMMREHVQPSTRMHYVIESGGESPNVVPDYARLRMFVRDQNRPSVEATTTWASELAQGAALGTQTRAEFNCIFGMYNQLSNKPLIENSYKHLTEVGVPDWSPEEQEFARECQRNFGTSEAGLATSVMPILPPTVDGGGSDVADVSWNTPTIMFGYPSFPLGIGLHTWPVTACGGGSIGAKAAHNVSRILARMGLDLLTDATLREEARADLNARRGDEVYTSPLAAD